VIAAPRSALIRRAAPGDVPTLGRLGVALVRMHHGFDPRRFLASTAGDERGYVAYLGAQLEARRAVVLVAEHAGEVVGYAYGAVEGADCMALRGEAGMLHDLYVLPGQRGRGLGRTLLTEAIAALDALGAPRFVLSTAERNGEAQRLFASIGFRRTMIEMTRERDAH
jgi:ribosomal protein S18 acetylase RimI-like enzyme